MADLFSSFKKLFGRSVKPDNPANLAEIAHIRATQSQRAAEGLSPEKLASILRQAREGEIEAYLELAEAMEERDLHYYSLLQTRRLAVTGADWVVEGSGDEDPIAEALEEEVLSKPEFRWLCADLLDAVGKGFAVCQPVWDTSGSVNGRWQFKEFKRIDPRVFKFDVLDMTTLMLRDPTAITNGQTGSLVTPDLIVHYPRLRAGVPIRGGLAMLAAVTWMFKNFTVKDWMSFNEVYGMPLKVLKFARGVTTDEDKAAMRRGLSNLGHDAAMLIPDDAELEVFNGRTGTSPYLELAEYFDKQLSKGVLGQTMTSDDGSSLAQASVHEKVRQDIAQADAQNLSATIMRYVVTPWVRLNFGEKAKIPLCYPDTSPPEDLKAWSDAVVPLINAGLKVPAKFARAKFSIPDPQAGEEVIEKPAPEPAAAPGKLGQPKPKVAPNALSAAGIAATAEDVTQDALDDWEPILVDYHDTIEGMAHESKTYEEFLARVAKLPREADSNEFVKRLAIAAAEARLVAQAN